jgi:hypothetical protein
LVGTQISVDDKLVTEDYPSRSRSGIQGSIRGLTDMKKFAIAAISAATIALGLVSAASAGETLKSHEIKKFVPGSATAKIMGSNVSISMSRSGRLSAKWDGERDTGTWRVSGDQLCIRFNKWMNGATRCSAVTKAGNSYRVAGVTFSKR